jgi:hypothetical protein
VVHFSTQYAYDTFEARTALLLKRHGSPANLESLVGEGFYIIRRNFVGRSLVGRSFVGRSKHKKKHIFWPLNLMTVAHALQQEEDDKIRRKSLFSSRLIEAVQFMLREI